MARSVVILGAGMAGLPLAHFILKNYADRYDLKIILISRSDQFFWNIASPRAVIPGQLSDDQVLFSVQDAFAKYPSHRFEFVHETVEKWLPEKNLVVCQRTIEYDTIIVATGSTYQDSPWKLTDNTSASLSSMRSKIAQARSITIAGGGPTGIELAGELGYGYKDKTITLVIPDSLPLNSRIMPVTRMAAMKELQKLNVNVVTNTRINDDKADLFIPAWGVKYNTSFAPVDLLDNGRLRVTSSLRAPGHNNAFVLGDAASLDCSSAAMREPQVRYVASAIGKWFAGEDLPGYTPPSKMTMTVAVGRGRGVGQIGGINLWSLFIWYFKSRHMCTNIAADYVAGKTLILGSF